MSEKIKFYNNKKVRVVLFQVFILVAFILFFSFIINNMFANMAKRGINTGFGFLTSSSGFGILQTLIDYNESSTYGRTFLVGLLNTLLVSGIGIVLATIIGFVVGVSRLSNNWLLKKLTTFYIEIFRNIPILLQILLWNTILRRTLPSEDLQIFPNVYISIEQLTIPEIMPKPFFYVMLILFFLLIGFIFFLRRYSEKYLFRTGKTIPFLKISMGAVVVYFIGFFLLINAMFDFINPVPGRFNFEKGSAIIPELFSLTIALSVYTATYISEAVRSGIEAVDKGQREAATALGLKKSVIMSKIIIPQAMRVIIPPTTNQYLNLTKNSSLATAIGYPDLVSVFAGTTLNQVGQAVEIMLMTMAVYLLISLSISLVLNIYNRKSKLVER